jgi:hypothetical protein
MTSTRPAALFLGRVAYVALGAVGLLLGGCKEVKGLGATGGCAVLGDCGGNPTGVWQVDTDPASMCTFPVVSRPAQNYANTTPAFEPETGAAAPATTSGGWCWDLSFSVDMTGAIMVSTPTVPMQAPDHIISGTVTFAADQSYTYSLTAVSTTPFHVARSCFGVIGAKLSCADFAVKLQQSSAGNNPVYMALAPPDGGAPPPSFLCADGGDGCDCTFDYTETDQNAVGDTGNWVVDPGSNVIHHYSAAGQGNLNETSPSRRTVRDATFCVTDGGNTLQLTGTNGTALVLKAGTRSLTLTRVIPDAGADVTNSGAGGATGAAGATGAGGDMGGAGADGGAAADATSADADGPS